MLKSNFMDAMFNIQLHNSFTKKKKKELPYVHSLFKRTLQFQYACKQRQGSISNSSARRKKISKLTAMKSRSCAWFFGGGRELCVWLPLSPLVSAREIKNSKRKTRRTFFFFNHDIPPPHSVMMMQVKLLSRERHLCSSQHYQIPEF